MIIYLSVNFDLAPHRAQAARHIFFQCTMHDATCLRLNGVNITARSVGDDGFCIVAVGSSDCGLSLVSLHVEKASVCI